MDNSFENVKVGDKLIVDRPFDVRGIETVERVTATLVITKNGRYFKKSGKLQGCDGWNFTYARVATQEEIDSIASEYKHKRLTRKCAEIDFSALSDAQLEQILEIANNPELLEEGER